MQEPQARKELILQWLINYSTIQEILFGFQCYKTANKWMARHVAAGLIQIAGTIAFKSTGRPLSVYCTNHWKGMSLTHEVMLSKVLQPYWLRGARFLRGYDVDPKLRPDAESVTGQKAYWEMDRGTEGMPKVASVLGKYEGNEGFVLFVTTSEERVQAVLRQSRHLADQLLCTTYSWLRAQPFGEVWTDVYGNRTDFDF